MNRTTTCWLAAIAILSFCIVGCTGRVPEVDPPQAFSPYRPETLFAEPTPTTLEQALNALTRGLSGDDASAIRRLNEDDAVAALGGVEKRLREHWWVATDGALRYDLAAAGFD